TAYATGLVHEAMGEKEKAHKAWEIASSIDRGEQRRSGNARLLKRSITRYGQGQPLEKLGRAGEAEVIFRELVNRASCTRERPEDRPDGRRRNPAGTTRSPRASSLRGGAGCPGPPPAG
ncbi:MAG: hypothetical protein ABSE84_30525, partial [Isosphaeraceae bacterium]